MRTAVFGGTFNPPHLGHERMVELVEEEIRPDRLLIIPTYISPHKEIAAGSPTPEQRLELCRAAFGRFGCTCISDIELKRKGLSYTADTLDELKSIYPDDDLSLIIGSDSLLCFTEWRRFEDILKECTLIVISREENDRELLLHTAEDYTVRYGAHVTVLTDEPFVLSSSEIRAGRLSTDTVSGPVLKYITENHLYGCV